MSDLYKSRPPHIKPPQCWKCDAKKPTSIEEGGLRQYTCIQCGATWNDRLDVRAGAGTEGFVPGVPTQGKRGGRDDY